MDDPNQGEDTDHDDRIENSGGSPAEEYCNPEPPPEMRNAEFMNADNIGDTVFSKHWLFTTLMSLIQTVDAHENSKREEGGEGGLDIEDSLQDELCKLWDMSMNPEVVKFLQEFQALDILTGVIAKSRAPRATEICVGILGNMACNADVCEQMANKTELVELLLLLFENPDAPTLVELTRLLHTAVSSRAGVSAAWVAHIQRTPGVFTHISFILQSSTNNELLLMTSQLVRTLLYADDFLCAQWACAELVLAVLETVRQVGGESGIENVEIFLHILQLVSTCESGVEALLSYGEELVALCMRYLSHVCSEEVVVLSGQESSIGSALSVVNVLIASWEDRKKFLQEDYELVRCTLKILEEVFPRYNARRARQLRRMRSRSQSSNHSPPRLSVTSETPAHEAMNISHGSEESADALAETEKSAHALAQPTSASSSKHRDEGQKPEVTLGQKQDQSFVSEDSDSKHDMKKHSDDKESSLKSDEASKSSKSDQGVKSNGEVNSGSNEKMDDKRTQSGKHSETAGTSQEESKVSSVFQMLYDVIQTCITEIVLVLKQIVSSTRSLQGQGDMGVPECLDYLDTKCPTTRLQYFIHCLSQSALAEESQSKDLMQSFQTIVQTYKLERIDKVVRKLIS